MNLKSLEYFIEVAKDLNMTSAAQRLYISQQALSSQIQKLEQYYGVILFERQPKLQLTYAGQQLLEGATQLIQDSIAITNSLSEISSKRSGILRVGIPAYRASDCLPLILPEFTRRWPNVSIHLVEAPSVKMLEMLRDGALDVCIITPTSAEIQDFDDEIDFTFLMDDSTYLICSDELLRRSFGTAFEKVKKDALQGTDLLGFENMPFLLHKTPMRLRKIADECFNRAGYKPKVCIETSNTELMISLYPCHLGAFFCRSSRVDTIKQAYSDCNAFPVQSHKALDTTTVYFARRKSLHVPKHILDFERLTQKAWRQIAGR